MSGGMRLSLNGWSVSVKALLLSFAAVIGAVATILAKGGAVWSATGWETPNQHDRDISDVTMAVTAADSVTTAALVELQTRWLCDEKEEDLEKLYAIQNPTEAVRDDIETIKTRMGDGPSGLQCARFED